MSEIELATEAVTEIEELLESRFGARGHDIAEKLSSVEYELPPEIANRIRFVASIRDMLVSQSGARMLSVSEFVSERNEAVDWLRQNRTDKQLDRKLFNFPKGRGRLIIAVLGLVTVMLVIILLGANRLEQTHGDSSPQIRLPQINR